VQSPHGEPGRRKPPRVAVCVITYRRPEGLARLLAALDAQVLPEPSPAVRVVVVDNDPEETARVVCRHAASWLGFPLTYATEKRRGIPQARNAALALVLGDDDFVAFVDDDSEPAADWLAQLLRMQAERDADAVTGPSPSRFEGPPPSWIEAGGFFERRRHPDGAEVGVAFTGNVLVRTRALAALDRLFDERLALSGGSDSELFQRFARAGHRIVWADRAVVTEHVPLSRATLGWILRRAFRVTTSNVFIARLHGSPEGRTSRLLLRSGWCLAKGGVVLFAAPFRAFEGADGARAQAVRALRLWVSAAARIAGLFGVLTREYAVTHGR